MQTANLSPLKLSIAALALMGFIACGTPLHGQKAPARGGSVEDWTHHHVVFSNPGTAEEAEAHGRYNQWRKIVDSDRYQFQLTRRSSSDKPFIDDGHNRVRSYPKPAPKGNSIHQDWAQNILADGQVQPNMFPAKYSFDTTTASCPNDFVVLPTGVTPSGTLASIYADNNLYTGGCTGTVPAVYWAYNTGGMVSTSPVLSRDGTQVAFVQVTGTTASLVLLTWGPNQGASTFTGGVTNNSVNFTFTSGALTAADVGAQITGTGIPANDTIASITGLTTGTLTTQVTGTHASETLTEVTQALATPALPVTVTAANYNNCAAPCMFKAALSGTVNDTYSAPYYDYANDVLYVGDNSGHLHKFTGVFLGTPTEATPVVLGTIGLASPVYDSTSGCVFVGDTTGTVYSVSSGIPGTVCTGSTFASFGHSTALGGAANEGVFDAPLVDPSTQSVYFFVADGKTGGGCTVGTACIAEFDTNTITSGATTTAAAQAVSIGTGGANDNLYAGAFDNIYYSSTNGTAGNIWVMGNSGVAGGNLYRVPITNTGNMGTAVAVISGLTDTTTGHFAFASPITEFCNNGTSPCVSSGTATTTGTDYIFFSVNRLQTATTNCGNASGDGCILAYSVDSPGTTGAVAVGSATAKTPASPGCYATGGIVVDNSVPSGTLAGTSQFYTYELNGNGAGGPTRGTYSSSDCTTGDTATPIALQDDQNL